MDLPLRHRHAIALPFVLLAIVALIGGVVNSVDARGRIVDGLTEKGVKDATITHGVRVVKTDEQGEFVMENVPRMSRVRIDRSGYLRTFAPTTAEEVRLSPLSVTIYATEEGKAPLENVVPNPQARQGGKILATGNASGQIIVAPHPGKDATVLICAEGFESKEITVEGVLMQMTLKRGGTGCPPLPTPSPAPGASPSPTAPPPSPSPSPARSP